MLASRGLENLESGVSSIPSNRWLRSEACNENSTNSLSLLERSIEVVRVKMALRNEQWRLVSCKGIALEDLCASLNNIAAPCVRVAEKFRGYPH